MFFRRHVCDREHKFVVYTLLIIVHPMDDFKLIFRTSRTLKQLQKIGGAFFSDLLPQAVAGKHIILVPTIVKRGGNPFGIDFGIIPGLRFVQLTDDRNSRLGIDRHKVVFDLTQFFPVVGCVFGSRKRRNQKPFSLPRFDVVENLGGFGFV